MTRFRPLAFAAGSTAEQAWALATWMKRTSTTARLHMTDAVVLGKLRAVTEKATVAAGARLRTLQHAAPLRSRAPVAVVNAIVWGRRSQTTILRTVTSSSFVSVIV